MSDWNKPYPYHYTIDDHIPELEYVFDIVKHHINKLLVVYPNSGCYTHSYVENSDGTTSVETTTWYNVKSMSGHATQLCNGEYPDMVCIIMKVGKFSNGVTSLYKYNRVGKYKVNVRFYKSPNPNVANYTNDDSEHQIGTPNIRVGEFVGLFGNLQLSYNLFGQM